MNNQAEPYELTQDDGYPKACPDYCKKSTIHCCYPQCEHDPDEYDEVLGG